MKAIVKLGKKAKTFISEEDANRFLGAYDSNLNGMEISAETYYRRKLLSVFVPLWDDFIEMTPDEWVDVSKSLISGGYILSVD